MLCPARKNQDGSPTEPAEVELRAIGNDRKWLKETATKAAGRAGENDGTASFEQAYRQVDGPKFRIVESNPRVNRCARAFSSHFRTGCLRPATFCVIFRLTGDPSCGEVYDSLFTAVIRFFPGNLRPSLRFQQTSPQSLLV